MSTKRKKQLLLIGTAIVFFFIIIFGWRLFSAIIAQGTTENYTRSAMPYGFVLVWLFPIVATSTLFLGLARAK
ncbi:hypothetical protein [Tetragenococcus solitarius]|uniref:Uncharacterized protein n=1 Tax=Tetragenococcus solitarius TaxID=71453 RepID=A0ABN3Y490_9ENTE|nr:hypothetical protein [Tetragenococcus solitarius]